MLLLLKGTGLTTSLQLHHTAVRGCSIATACPIGWPSTPPHLWLDFVLVLVRHADLLELSAVAILMCLW